MSSAYFDKLTESIHRRELVGRRKLNDPPSIAHGQRVDHYDQRLHPCRNYGSEGAFELIRVVYPFEMKHDL